VVAIAHWRAERLAPIPPAIVRASGQAVQRRGPDVSAMGDMGKIECSRGVEEHGRSPFVKVGRDAFDGTEIRCEAHPAMS
jgi:hypothetical protein